MSIEDFSASLCPISEIFDAADSRRRLLWSALQAPPVRRLPGAARANYCWIPALSCDGKKHFDPISPFAPWPSPDLAHAIDNTFADLRHQEASESLDVALGGTPRIISAFLSAAESKCSACSPTLSPRFCGS